MEGKLAGLEEAAADQHTQVAMEKLLAHAASLAAVAALGRGAAGLYERFNRKPLMQARKPQRSVLELPYQAKAASIPSPLSGPLATNDRHFGMEAPRPPLLPMPSTPRPALNSSTVQPVSGASRGFLAPQPPTAPQPTPGPAPSPMARPMLGPARPAMSGLLRPGASAASTVQPVSGVAHPPAPASPQPKRTPLLTSQVGYGNLRQRAQFRARTAMGTTPNAVGAALLKAGTVAARAPSAFAPGIPSIKPMQGMFPVAPGFAPGLANRVGTTPGSPNPVPKMGPVATNPGSPNPWPKAAEEAASTIFTEPANQLSNALGLLRNTGKPSPWGSWLDTINPQSAMSGKTMPWLWAAAPPVLAGAAYAGYKPVDSAMKWLRSSDDEDDLTEAKSRYNRLLHEQAGIPSGDHTKRADMGDGLDFWTSTLAGLASIAGMGGLYAGYQHARAGSSDKVLSEALRQRRQARFQSNARPLYLKPVPVTAPEPKADEDDKDAPTDA